MNTVFVRKTFHRLCWKELSLKNFSFNGPGMNVLKEKIHLDNLNGILSVCDPQDVFYFRKSVGGFLSRNEAPKPIQSRESHLKVLEV